MIAIAAIGLCTAQGTAAELIAGGPLAIAGPLPFEPHPRSACRIGFAARGIAATLEGPARWRALAGAALAEAGWTPGAPLVVGSCNGGAAELDGTTWRDAFTGLGLGDAPIASAACASGLHALWLATRLIAAGRDEVTVLAADILSPASHANFEALRVVAPAPAPWQTTAIGFVPGEAAVAIRLVRARVGDGLPRLAGPVLAHDRDDADALAGVAAEVATAATTFVVGQGTGPVSIDDRELAAIGAVVPGDVPLATALAHFGHTVGASSLLSVALAALARRAPVAALPLGRSHARDGRPLGSPSTIGDVLVVCRALGGACAAAAVGDEVTARAPRPAMWGAPSSLPPLRMPVLRRIAAEAMTHRPAAPPPAILVCLDAPLVPPEDARIGSRILPSVVLELTPGFIAQLISRAWGFHGPAVSLVGADPGLPIVTSCRAVEPAITVVYVRGDDVEWGGS